MKVKCPHCEKKVTSRFFDSAFTNCECYGSKNFLFQCPKCKEVYTLYFSRTVKVGDPVPIGAKEDLSWGEE